MTARKHHFVPQCYLKGFVKHRAKPKLYVVDGKARRQFLTTPANVAAERDFNRIDTDGLEPDALEQAFSSFESKLSTALERITAARSLRHEGDRAVLFNFIALLAVKNPRLRETFRDFHERVMHQVLDVATATPERWASQVSKAKEAGYIDKNADTDYEAARSAVHKKTLRAETSTMMHLQIELGVLDDILPTIFRRKWLVLRAPPKSVGFITCDHPMCLIWSTRKERGILSSPGLGLLGTEILFPVSKEVALVGAFEIEDREIDVTPDQVAAFNGGMVAAAERQVYARDGEFAYSMGPGDKIRRGAELLNDRRFNRPRAN